MLRKTCVLLSILLLHPFLAYGGLSQTKPQTQESPNVAFINGQWFNGKSFEVRTVYSVGGRFTSKKPKLVDRTLDLAGLWIVPPFAEAHNHNIDGVIEERSKRAIQKYLTDGVFYVKIQGNFPLTEEMRSRLPINRPGGIDVALAQTFLTATGGHPIRLHENILMPQGYYQGLTKERLQDNLYFTLDSEADLEKKWPLILKLRPDFIKTNLWYSDEFEKRKGDAIYFGRKALDPRLLPKIVAKAHASGLRVSVHITNAADFHNAVTAGVDEIVHAGGTGLYKTLEKRIFDPAFMRDGDLYVKLITDSLLPSNANNPFYIPISAEDAKRAARRGIVVITTAALMLRSPEAVRAVIKPEQAANLKVLQESGVRLAIGSDNVLDSSVIEAEYLRGLGLFDNLTLLKMWTETTAKTIFPNRKIGALRDGYEASFLALEGNPLEDWQNVRKIKWRFKQGFLLEP
jgi:hypothetical protein